MIKKSKLRVLIAEVLDKQNPTSYTNLSTAQEILTLLEDIGVLPNLVKKVYRTEVGDIVEQEVYSK